ncbi:alanine racemase [Alteribacter populi]|uniref:alanine racemase n=1 Tax=Alteribacter populi TaxID=2011011 RepID=UPI000BBAACD8|nr:alanine racemase [Alteribacter populi]
MNLWKSEPTPSLLLDINQMKRNIERMVWSANKNGVNLRPHIKTHKSVEIARLEIEAGAYGITVATLSEAELFVKAGFKDILLAFPLVGKQKVDRLAALCQESKVIASVDDEYQAFLLQESAEAKGIEIEVWMKVNSGLNRCGVESGKEALTLAQGIRQYGSLKLTGIYTHAGHAYGFTEKTERSRIAQEEAKAVLESVRLCEDEDISIPNRSVGSTPTYEEAGKFEGITEVRPGNAVFFDGVQEGLGVCEVTECALSVSASVVSIKEDRIIFDAGSKSLTSEKGAHGNESVKGFGTIVEPVELQGFSLTRLSEEHGVLDGNGSPLPSIKFGETIRIVPNHACTAVNLYDTYTVIQDERVVDRWKVDARGCNV